MRSIFSPILLLWVLACGTFAAQHAESAPNNSGTEAGISILTHDQEIDADQGLRSCYPPAERLEAQLGLLAPGDPKRAALARELIGLYRGDLGHFSRAAFWARTIADELRPTPEGIDALFELGDTLFNHGKIEQALAVYKEILKGVVAPEPPWDSKDDRCWAAWHGEKLCKEPTGTDPLFRPDVGVSTALNRFVQLARSSNPAEAGAVLERNLDLRSVIQQASDPPTWTSARAWLGRAMAQLPEHAIRRLEQHYRQQLAAEPDKHDWRRLATFRFRRPAAGVGCEIDRVIGDELLDADMPALASLFYGQARRAMGDSAPAELIAKELFCRIHGGEQIAPAEVPDVEVEIGGEKHPLRAWAEGWHPPTASSNKASAQNLDLQRAVLSRLPLARACEPLRRWQLKWIARSDTEVPEYAPEFVPHIPVGSADNLVINSGDVIEAVDVANGRRLWTFVAPEENAMAFPNQEYKEKKLFIECARARTAAVVGDRVYAQLAWGHHDTRRQGSGLFGLRRTDGAMIWSSLSVPELASLDIAADPAVDRGVVVALAWRQRETLPPFYVVGLAAETGELLWMNYLYSGSSLTVCDNEHFLDRPLACGPPTIADGVAYLTTGAGVVAAVNVVDGTLLWAVEYPRVRAINASGWAIQAATSRPAGIVAVVGEVVIFAPIDSHVLLAVDRNSGQVRYTQESLDLKGIAAADDQRAYLLEGTTVRAIDAATGKTVWRRCFNTTGLVGLPTLGGRGLLCPSWESLYILDPASGEMVARRGWGYDEAFSYIRDFGDRLVGASRTGLHVLADKTIDEGSDWHLPPSGNEEALEVAIPSREDKWLRWVLPAVNRGDFILSDKDPGHILIRSEMIQMRAIDPVPALRWERASPLPWSYEAAFDDQHVAVWDASNLYVLDAGSGRTIWEKHLGRPLEPSGPGRVELGHGDVVWWGTRRIDGYEAATGKQRWSVTPEGTVRGIRFLEQGLGVYVERPGPQAESPAHAAILLDRATGKELARLAITRPEPAPTSTPEGKPLHWARLDPLIVGVAGRSSNARAGDVVLVDGRQLAGIDWDKRSVVAGEATGPLPEGPTHGARLEISDKYVYLTGRDDDGPRYHESLLAVWNGATRSRVGATPMLACAIAGDRLYGYDDHRVRAIDLPTGQQAWQGLTLLDEVRAIVPAGDYLLVLTQDGRFNDRDIRDVSCVRVFDIRTGDRVQAFKLPKRWMHVVEPSGEGLMLWDCTWLYRVKAPSRTPSTQPWSAPVRQTDPDAVAALRTARDLEDAPRTPVVQLALVPRIDADLSDWANVPPIRLEGPMDWKPDFAHWSRQKARAYGGKQDLSATVRVGRTAEAFCLAVEVVDDVHVASAEPGLWRSDSVTLGLARSGGNETDPTLLTVGLVCGSPRFEWGTAVSTFAVSDPPGSPPPTGPGPRAFVLPALASLGSDIVPLGESLEVAILRDESNRTTTYELRINGAAWASLPEVYWDVLVNDNDGQDREGALQLASSVWGIEETPIGAVPETK